MRISQYLRWLRNDCRKPDGQPLAEKSIKHHYNVLNLIFGYAEKQDIIQKNPMKKVDPPKVSKREVDALTGDEAVRFFNALLACDFEFRCMHQYRLQCKIAKKSPAHDCLNTNCCCEPVEC